MNKLLKGSLASTSALLIMGIGWASERVNR